MAATIEIKETIADPGKGHNGSVNKQPLSNFLKLVFLFFFSPFVIIKDHIVIFSLYFSNQD